MPLTKIVNGIPVEMTPQEEAAFEAARTPTLSDAKRAKKEAIADRRLQAETSGFRHLTVLYASKPQHLSRMAILAERARTAKAAAESFTVRVVAADDSETNMNANEYIALEKSAGDHFIACSANARTLRQAVNAAADLVAVLSIDIEAGWPA
jgi:hypothetical protein